MTSEGACGDFSFDLTKAATGCGGSETFSASSRGTRLPAARTAGCRGRIASRWPWTAGAEPARRGRRRARRRGGARPHRPARPRPRARRCARPPRPPSRPAARPCTRYGAVAAAGRQRPLPVPWPAEAREELVTLLGAGGVDHPGVGGPGGRGADHPAAARLGARALPAAAQRRPHLDRRPAPGRGGRPGLRPHPPRRPPRPAAGRRAAARHRQGLARRPLRGRRDHRPRRRRPDRLRPRRRRASSPRSCATICCSIETATRRDLDDPATVRPSPTAVGSGEHPGTPARPHRGRRARHRARRLVAPGAPPS